MRTEENTLIITGKAPETKLRLKKILYIKKSSPKNGKDGTLNYGLTYYYKHIAPLEQKFM